MNQRIVLMVLIIAAFVFYKKSHSNKIAFISNFSIRTTLSDYKVDQTTQIDKCSSQKKCIYIYVAPWCPACHDFLKQYSMIKNKLAEKNIGTLLVVGSDENRSKEVAMKEELGADAVLDTIQGDFRKQNGIDSFPYMIVTESENKVIAVGQSAVDFINKNINN